MMKLHGVLIFSLKTAVCSHYDNIKSILASSPNQRKIVHALDFLLQNLAKGRLKM